MTISILLATLATLATCAVLLDDVAATLAITAPSTVIDTTGELETREQGPTAWICSDMSVESPWTAYANIRGYLEGGNVQGKNYTNLVLYPVMELFHTTQNQSRLCVYLPAEDHCYPPAPSTDAVKAVKQLTKRTYFAIRFWGQASNARVQYYKQKLTKALTTYNKAANLDLFFVSFFSDHVREVRYDPATAVTRPSNGLTTTQGIVVSTTTAGPVISTMKAVPDVSTTTAGPDVFSTTEPPPWMCPTNYKRAPTIQAGKDKYFTAEVDPQRLTMFDIQMRQNEDTLGYNDCMKLASSKGYDAFKDKTDGCYLYNFGAKDFCPCTGKLQINVNVARLEQTEGRWQNLPHPNKGLDEIIIYTEIPAEQFQAELVDQSTATSTANCENALLQSPVKKQSMSAIFNKNSCYTSYIHDAANCNQTCRGVPGKALVRKINPYPIVHFLSRCGQSVQVTAKSEPESSIYLSHPGTGCYYYPEAQSPEGENCIIKFFKMSPTEKALEVVFDYVNLDRNSSGGCGDELLLYNGLNADKASLQDTICSAGRQPVKRATFKDGFTINFHRVPKFKGTGKIGFRLTVFNL